MRGDFFGLKNKKDIVIGVTGHRNLVKDDYSDIIAQLREGFCAIIDLHKTTDDAQQRPSVLLLTGLAQGADMLAAKVARELGVPYVAVLPCELEKYKKSFDDPEALAELDDYIHNATEVVIVDDIEKDFDNQPNQNEDSYRYRQVGIYIVQRASLLVALWDGKPPKSQYGCGTADVVNIALKSDCPVLWVNCRRVGDGSNKNVTATYLPPSQQVED